MSEPKAAGEKPKSKKTLLFVVIGLLVIGGGAGGVFWWKSQHTAEAATKKGGGHGEAPKEHANDESEAEVSGALPFQPFVVNLADPGVSRYLKADVRLLVSGAENLEEVEEDKVVMLRLRSAILELLSVQTSDQLVTPEGKDALKKAIAERCSKILAHMKVADVLFTEFVVQF